MPTNSDWKLKTFIVGGLAGLAIGVFAAYIMVQRAEREETQPKLNAGDGVKLGMGVLGVLRLLSDMITK